MSVEEYDILNLNCANCSNKIESEIKSMPEVSSVNLDFFNKKLIVQYHNIVDNPLERLNQIASAIEPGVLFTHKSDFQHKHNASREWVPIGLGLVILLIANFIFPEQQTWLGLTAYILIAHKVLLSSLRAIWGKRVFSEQLLMSIATIGAMILGEYNEACAVIVLYTIGQALENRAVNHSRKSIKSMLTVKPELAHLRTNDGLVDKRIAEIVAGDTILIYPGERIPLDGIISKGESTVDTSSLTGEAEPLFVSAETEIYAGFLNNSGLLELKVTGTDSESTITRILNLIENAGARKSPQEKFITRFAAIYTPVIVGLAALVFIVPTLFGLDAAIWFKRSLVFLIVSCPCALVISIPLTYFIGIGIAAKRGIILKGSTFLDALQKVRTMVFDKTGTLTTGELTIDKVYLHSKGEPAELLEALFLCEYTSSHPFAKAVKKAYDGVFDIGKVTAYIEIPGKGVALDYSGDRYSAGSENYLSSLGYSDLIKPPDSSIVHVAKNEMYLGCATFSDEVKPHIKDVIASLKKQGVRQTVMLSGDRNAKAEKVSKELGLDSFFAELLPEQKLQILEGIIAQTTGNVAFVGDGMNDAPALARADVGIAMGGIGNQASIEAADIVLLNDHPKQLDEAFSIARNTRKVVIQNIVFALGVKVLVMILGVSGVSGLWEAIIADVGVTLLVVFNSLRMMRIKSLA